MTDDELDQALRALAHPARRLIMRATTIGPLPAGEVATILDVAAATASEHLRVLRRAGLAECTAQGPRRLYRALPARIIEVTSTLLERTVPSPNPEPTALPPNPEPTALPPNPAPTAPLPNSAQTALPPGPERTGRSPGEEAGRRPGGSTSAPGLDTAGTEGRPDLPEGAS